MIEGHAVGAASTAIVSRDEEPFESEGVHDPYLIPRHRSLRVRFVVAGGLRLRALAISSEIRRDHGEGLRQPRGNLMPHHVSLRMSMEQQERGAASPHPKPNFGFLSLYLLELESLEQALPLRSGHDNDP